MYVILINPYIQISLNFAEIGLEACEGIQFSDDESNGSVKYKPELAILSAPTILLTLEAGVGNKTLPMLLLHLNFQSNVNDWSTKTVIILQLTSRRNSMKIGLLGKCVEII